MIGGRYVKGEQIRINYEAYRLTTGLSDVTISIIKSDGNKEIDGASMTELNSTNAPGIYYYDWTPTKPGTMTIYCDSSSTPKTYVDILQVDARGSKYTQVMGVHGGMSRVTVNDTWTDAEKQTLLDEIKNISESHKKSAEMMGSLTNNIQTLENRSKLMELGIGDQINKSQKMSQNLFREVANKVNQLNEETGITSSKVLASSLENKDLFKDIDRLLINKFKLLDDKIGTLEVVHEANIALIEKMENLKDEVKELHGNISQFGRILIKILPPEKLMELKDEVQ